MDGVDSAEVLLLVREWAACVGRSWKSTWLFMPSATCVGPSAAKSGSICTVTTSGSASGLAESTTETSSSEVRYMYRVPCVEASTGSEARKL